MLTIQQVRELLANSAYDNIKLSIGITSESVEEGCYMCCFNDRADRCKISDCSTIADSGAYYDNCQLKRELQ